MKNDNELSSFIQIAAATANVVRYLVQDKPSEEVEPRKETTERDSERANEEECRNIERRIRDILAMENRLRRKRI